MNELQIKKQNVTVNISDIKKDFDARADLTFDDATVAELVRQGYVKQLPLLTDDNVLVDGRTGFRALIELGTKDGKQPETIQVDKLGVVWEDATPETRHRILAFSLHRNLLSTGYRRPATQDDIAKIVNGYLQDGLTETHIIELLACASLTRSRLQGIILVERTRRKSQIIAKARQHLATHPSQSLKQVAAKFGVTTDSLVTRSKPGSAPRSLTDLKKRQNALERAARSVKHYGEANLRYWREESHGMSAKMVIRMAQYQYQTAQKILQAAEEVLKNTQSIVVDIMPEAHRY